MTPLRQILALKLDVKAGEDGKILIGGLSELPPETAAEVKGYVRENRRRILAELLGPRPFSQNRAERADVHHVHHGQPGGHRCFYNCQFREPLPDSCWWVFRCGKTGRRTSTAAECLGDEAG